MATEIKVTNFPRGYQSLISNGRHTILADEPINSKGTDLGMSPPDLILSSLAMCKAATVRFIARKKGWEVGEVEANLSQKVKRERDGSLTTNVSVRIHIEGDLTDEQRQELIKEADACYVHRMIEGNWNIEAAVEDLEPSTI